MARKKAATSSTTPVDAGGATQGVAVAQVDPGVETGAPAGAEVEGAPAAEVVAEVAVVAGGNPAGDAAADAPSLPESLAAMGLADVTEQAAEDAAPADDQADQPTESVVHTVADDPLWVWLNTAVFPCTVTVRNHSSMARTEPITAAYIGAGASVQVCLHNPDHAASVIGNLASLNDTATGPRGLTVDELPFALTKKGC